VSDPAPFPPVDLAGFLQLCAGEWLALRSRFDFGQLDGMGDGTVDGVDEPAAAAAAEEEPWHRSDRGELRVEHLPATADHLGVLLVTPPGAGGPSRLTFLADGRFDGDGGDGTWQLWPDGSLELVAGTTGLERRERIWFTKVNLRLRSCVEQPADGGPARASFSSEIRRVVRP
jgi:hypothetical protein